MQSSNVSFERLPNWIYMPAMRRCELSATITQLMSKCMWSGWKWKKGYKKKDSPFTCYPLNREYSWKKSQVEKKSKLCVITCKNGLLVYGGWRASWIFHDGGPHYAETSSLIFRTNQWTGFYTTGTSVMKELMLCLLLASIHWDILLNYEKIIGIKGGCFWLIKLSKRLTLEKHVNLT